MVRGTLEVLLVGAKGLRNTDFLRNMDPYAILICRTQEQRSSIASDKGSDPEWNENFVFTVSDSVPELIIKLMDSDSGSADDFVGEAIIPLKPVFAEGSITPTVYNVVKDQEYCGEIKVGLCFTPEFVKPITVPLRASKRLAGLKAKPIAITEISDPSSRAKAKRSDQLKVNQDSKKVFERSDKLNDIPIIDLESDEPEINEPLEEQVAVGKLRKEPSGIPLKLPFGEWHDPCIEFAFKTLTGDIPPLEGCSAIMDYFRQKLISIQSPSQNGSSTLTSASPESSPKPSLHSEGRAP